MGKKFTALDTSRESRAYYEEHWPVGGVYVIPPNEAPPLLLSSGILAKTWRIVVVASGLSGGPVDYLFNPLRVEEEERAFDQHPVIVRFSGNVPSPSAYFPNRHAKFPGRTILLSGVPWAAFDANRSGSYAPPISGLPVATSGFITDLGSPLLDAAYLYAAARMSGC